MTEDQIRDSKYEPFARAMFLSGLPCNSRPFISAWRAYTDTGGHPESDTAKAIGWMILSIQTGVQIGSIDLFDNPHDWNSEAHMTWPDVKVLDMFDEWNRLNKTFNLEP